MNKYWNVKLIMCLVVHDQTLTRSLPLYKSPSMEEGVGAYNHSNLSSNGYLVPPGPTLGYVWSYSVIIFFIFFLLVYRCISINSMGSFLFLQKDALLFLL